MIHYTHPTRPGVWTKEHEIDGREGRCIDCGDSVTITSATFVQEETGQRVQDRAQLCSCDASYGYAFKLVQEESHAHTRLV